MFDRIEVAAGVVKDAQGRILICRRKGALEGLWEFPGGKIEEGETPFEAIIREIREELSAEIEPSGIFCEYPFSYPEKEIYFYFIRAKLLSEKIEPTFHSEIKWLFPSEAENLEFCPADISAAEKIKGEYK